MSLLRVVEQVRDLPRVAFAPDLPGPEAAFLFTQLNASDVRIDAAIQGELASDHEPTAQWIKGARSISGGE